MMAHEDRQVPLRSTGEAANAGNGNGGVTGAVPRAGGFSSLQCAAFRSLTWISHLFGKNLLCAVIFFRDAQ